MSEAEKLADWLDQTATSADMGRPEVKTDNRRLAAKALRKQQAEIDELRKALADRDAKGKTMIDFKLQATGIPESIEQYQLALDAAFTAGKAIAAGAAPTPTGKVRLNGITC